MQTLMENLSGDRRCIIGMVHCLPLPGTLNYGNDVEAIYSRAVADALALEQGGVDAIIVENTNDYPNAEKLSPVQVALLAAITRTVVRTVSIPVGVDAAFNDGVAGLAIAAAAGATFIRCPAFVDRVQVAGLGMVEPCAGQVIAYRRQIGAAHIKIFADVQVKHSHMALESVTLEESAQAARDCGADAIIVTGLSTGLETPLESVKRVKAAVSLPIIIGSGFRIGNAEAQLEYANGAIVGSALKQGGVILSPIDGTLCRELIGAVTLYRNRRFSHD